MGIEAGIAGKKSQIERLTAKAAASDDDEYKERVLLRVAVLEDQIKTLGKSGGGGGGKRKTTHKKAAEA